MPAVARRFVKNHHAMPLPTLVSAKRPYTVFMIIVSSISLACDCQACGYMYAQNRQDPAPEAPSQCAATCFNEGNQPLPRPITLGALYATNLSGKAFCKALHHRTPSILTCVCFQLLFCAQRYPRKLSKVCLAMHRLDPVNIIVRRLASVRSSMFFIACTS